MEQFGLLCCVLWIFVCQILRTECGQLTVSDDISVKPSTNDQQVNISLTCVGTESSLEYYIKNPITWSHVDHLNNEEPLTKSFFRDSLYEEDHHKVTYTETPPIQFTLHIFGVEDSDDGIYQCAQRDKNMTIMFSKNVSVTVLRPVEKIELEVRDMEQSLLHRTSTKASADVSPLFLIPGEYTVKCIASGSNPAPLITFVQKGNKNAIAVESTKNFDNEAKRVKFTGSELYKISVSPKSSDYHFVCEANIPGDTYPLQSAGVTVRVDTPKITCTSSTNPSGNLHNVTCNIVAREGLDCNKVKWEARGKSYKHGPVKRQLEELGSGSENRTLVYCTENDAMLETVFTVSELAYEYSIVYGNGEFAQRESFVISDGEVDTVNSFTNVRTVPSWLLCVLIILSLSLL